MATAINYLQTIFSPFSPTIASSIFDNIPNIVTETMNNDLNKEFTAEEITTAFRDMIRGKPREFTNFQVISLGNIGISLARTL